MSVFLLRYTIEFRRNNSIVPFEELGNSPPLLLEITTGFNKTWPSRTWKEVQQELLRLRRRWDRVLQKHTSIAVRKMLADSP
jgi:hypothetical protein